MFLGERRISLKKQMVMRFFSMLMAGAMTASMFTSSIPTSAAAQEVAAEQLPISEVQLDASMPEGGKLIDNTDTDVRDGGGFIGTSRWTVETGGQYINGTNILSTQIRDVSLPALSIRIFSKKTESDKAWMAKVAGQIISCTHTSVHYKNLNILS